MKKLILLGVGLLATAGVYAQGLLSFNTGNNGVAARAYLLYNVPYGTGGVTLTNLSPTWGTGGTMTHTFGLDVAYVLPGNTNAYAAVPGMTTATPVRVGIYVGAVGSTSNELQLLSVGGYVANISAAYGYILDSSGGNGRLVVPTIPAGTPAAVQLRAWTGNYASYEDALAAYAANPSTMIYAGASEILTTGPLGGGTAGAALLRLGGNTGRTMYSYLLTPVPEPSVLGLGALGLVSLLFLRRRK